MPRKALLVVAALVLSLAAALVGTGSHAPPAISEESGRAGTGAPPPARDVLVRFKAGTTPAERAQDRSAARVELEDVLPLQGLQRVHPKRGRSVRQAAARLERSPEVLYAELDHPRAATVVPDDTYFPYEWGLHNTGQSVRGRTGTADADIDAPQAWDVTTGSTAVTVGVVDSGLDYTHPDLAPNMWSNPGESGSGRESNGADDDGNGFVDDWRGWDWVEGDNAPSDANGHGTHVAGTVGARGNDGRGVTGVAWRTGLAPLRALDADGSGYVSDVVSAYSYARQKGIKIVNASLGGPSSSLAERDAIAAAPNTLFVVAAGNDGENNDTAGSFPCNYPLANVLCVAASDQDDALASFSNYGAATVDLAAPGVDVASTWPGGEYAYLDGTSMATPHVAGAAALLWSREPGATTAAVRQTLLASVDQKPSLVGETLTGGRLNASRALGMDPRDVSVPSVGPDDPPPSSSPSSPSASSSPSGGSTPSTRGPVRRLDRVPPRLSLRVPRRLSLRTALRRGIRFRLRCSERCTFGAKVSLGARTARRLGFRGATRPVVVARARGAAAGSARRITLRLGRRARRRLRKLRSIRLRLHVRARDASRNAGTATRPIRLRR